MSPNIATSYQHTRSKETEIKVTLNPVVHLPLHTQVRPLCIGIFKNNEAIEPHNFSRLSLLKCPHNVGSIIMCPLNFPHSPPSIYIYLDSQL